MADDNKVDAVHGSFSFRVARIPYHLPEKAIRIFHELYRRKEASKRAFELTTYLCSFTDETADCIWYG